MNRLETALRLMNDERGKPPNQDKDTLLLRRKLALFEQKFRNGSRIENPRRKR